MSVKHAHEIEINIADVEVGEALLKCLFYRAVMSVRQLGGYEQLLARNSTFSDRLPPSYLKRDSQREQTNLPCQQIFHFHTQMPASVYTRIVSSCINIK